MDSSIDENFNHLKGSPFIHSTPLKAKNPKKKQQAPVEFICPNCGKKYVVKHYYLLHVDKCKSSTSQNHRPHQVSSSGHDISQNVHLDLSDVSLSHLGSQDQSASNFKVPAAPPKKKLPQSTKVSKPCPKPKLICTYCLKGYICGKSFKTHVRTHLIEVAASRFPNTADILAHSEEIGVKALTKVSNGLFMGESAAEFRELVGYVVSITSTQDFSNFSHEICNSMVISIQKVKFLLPSALVNSLMDDQETILSDPDSCDTFLKIINVGEQFSADVCAQFFLKFMLFFTTELLLHMSERFKASHPFNVVSKLVGEPDKEDRQVIYYIAGSIMRGYLKIAKRFPNSNTWREVTSVLTSKIFIDKPEGDISTDAEWTNDVDRGALLYINSKCQDLFVKITKVIFSHENHDGSIKYEAVVKKILNSELACDWDNIIGNSLSETVSLNLLSDIVQFFCKTCGRGIAKRRLNFIRRKPVASLTTRHLAASRRNR
ncbi:Zinc finger protein 177 [Frankliniella fusca]|uniref:Zinc finger protein 177 n=1 Tax=Frankliniella fusca TaxID=407009 RepID=A0AAE1LL73_9NEOP|nr:Zinc finger protein 177 [Frankliniella fusca]